MRKYPFYIPLIIILLVIIGCQPTPPPIDPISIQNTTVAIGNTAVAMAWTSVSQTQIASTPQPPKPTKSSATEDKTSFEFKVKVYRFIEERYKYYDSIDGGLTKDGTVGEELQRKSVEHILERTGLKEPPPMNKIFNYGFSKKIFDDLQIKGWK